MLSTDCSSSQVQEIRVRLPRMLDWQSRLRSMVFKSPARFIVAVMGRRAGKTTACAEISGTNALEVHRRDNFWGAPSFQLAQIGREKLLEMWRPVITKSESVQWADHFIGGGCIRWRSFGSDAGGIGRGYGLCVVDEAALVDSRQISQELIPTLADTNGKIVAITTPRGRRNVVFEWYQRAQSGDPMYACVHGPSTENPSPMIQAFVEVARENMPDDLFRQEIMAEFNEDASVVFRGYSHILDSTLTAPLPGRQYVLGVDLAKHQDYTVIWPMDLESGEFGPFDRFHRLPWPVQIERIETAHREWNGAQLCIDSTGVGDPILDELHQRGLPVMGVNLGGGEKERLILNYATAIERREIHQSPHPVALSEHEVYGYEALPSGRYRYSAPEGMHDDVVIAGALAVWARNRAPDSGLRSWMRTMAEGIEAKNLAVAYA